MSKTPSFNSKDSLLVVTNLKKYFPVETSFTAKILSRSKRFVHAVDDVSFYVKAGETLGLVGESGSGKTTIGKLILGLFEPTSGSVYFEGVDTKSVKGSAKKDLRKKMGVVFQDPYASLNPRKNIKDIVSLPLRTHGMKEKYNLSYLFIAHNMSIVHKMSDRIAVMYLGKIMEMADADEIAFDPHHPYTQALMSVIPIPDPKVEWGGIVLEGEIPSPINPPPGCVFKTRCPAKVPNFGTGGDTICDRIEPPLINLGKEHYVACHLFSSDSKGNAKESRASKKVRGRKNKVDGGIS